MLNQSAAYNPFTDIFDLLLGDQLDPDSLSQFIGAALAQIKYGIKRFSADLVSMGYSQVYARTTAQQIVPKPVFYALAIGYRASLGSVAQDLFSPRLHDDQRLALWEMQHELLAPAFIVYLFDQTIDDFNLGTHENTLIEQAIECAAEQLPHNPAYYRDQLEELLDYTLLSPGKALAKPLQPLAMLVPYIQRLYAAGIERDEIMDVLYTVSDILVHEHLGQMACTDLAGTFVQPRDFLDDVLGLPDSPISDSSAHTIARAGLRSQGYMMVAVSQYVAGKLAFEYSPLQGVYHGYLRPERYPTTVRQMIQQFPDSYDLLRLYELVVRVGDDAGDIPLDLERAAPNVLTGGKAVIAELIYISALDKAHISPRERDRFLDMLFQAEAMLVDHPRGEPVEIEDQLGHYMNTLIDLLTPFERAISDPLLAHLTGYDSLPDLRHIREEFRGFIEIIRAVNLGSIVNAHYNDAIAEAVGTLLIAA